MTEHTLWVEGKPVPKGRPRFANGHAYTPETTRAWEELIALAWRSEYPGWEPLAGPLEVEVFAMMDNPGKSDGDNIFKSIGDSLNGVAWVDDAQIMTSIVHKRCAGDFCEQGVGILVIVREL